MVKFKVFQEPRSEQIEDAMNRWWETVEASGAKVLGANVSGSPETKDRDAGFVALVTYNDGK